MTEEHNVTVDPKFKDWLSVSVGTDPNCLDVSNTDTQVLEGVVPLISDDKISDDKPRYITVWIKQMDNGNDKLIDRIYVKNTDNPLEPGDDTVNDVKSVYVIIADAQEKLESGADCVPENLRRYTFPMPGANITISAELVPLYGSSAPADTSVGSPMEGTALPDISSP